MKIRVVCPTCGAIYNVPEERLTAPRVHATCKVCSGRVEFARPEATTTHDAVREESASMEMIEPSQTSSSTESSTTQSDAPMAADAPTDAPIEDDRPTRQQRLAPIPADPEERETGTWEKAIIDNADADALVGEIEGTIPPERPQRPPLDPTTGLGNQTIRSPSDLDELFPEENPLPPPDLSPAPAPARRPAANADKPRNRRRQRSRLPMVLLLLSFLIVAAAAVYYYRDEIMSAL